MQNRINPHRRYFTGMKDYWLIPVPEGTPAPVEKRIVEESIRPYGILFKETGAPPSVLTVSDWCSTLCTDCLRLVLHPLY
ncbi:hypothetical protein NFI96_000283 [Prochilodus magdalenae]|nr:hypothetical protein NFI96_000283 [Prochilodus magdalenae]